MGKHEALCDKTVCCANLFLEPYKKRKYEDAITELIGKLDMTDSGKGMPSRLSLEEQGKFMLGYYHQRYEKKEDK